jgi:hypothetical protein
MASVGRLAAQFKLQDRDPLILTPRAAIIARGTQAAP